VVYKIFVKKREASCFGEWWKLDTSTVEDDFELLPFLQRGYRSFLSSQSMWASGINREFVMTTDPSCGDRWLTEVDREMAA